MRERVEPREVCERAASKEERRVFERSPFAEEAAQGLQKFSFTVMDTAPGTTSARVLPAAVFCCLRRATCGLARGLDMDLIRFV